jgi:acetyl esterase/lipase
VVFRLRAADAPVPAGVVLFSPLIDLTLRLARERERRRRDPMISATRAARLVALCTVGIDSTHPRLALRVTPGWMWPPTLIQAGGAEMLAGDAEYRAKPIRAAGGSCELQMWPEQAHVFQAFAGLIPEARARSIAGRLVRPSLGTAERPRPLEEIS